MNHPTLVDLPLELLDTIVDLAWSELPKPRCLARATASSHASTVVAWQR